MFGLLIGDDRFQFDEKSNKYFPNIQLFPPCFQKFIQGLVTPPYRKFGTSDQGDLLDRYTFGALFLAMIFVSFAKKTCKSIVLGGSVKPC